ncbi:HypC/HybG/HupF family hydrogenase formation chaperone [Demequina sp.]|uniref:HypC/HybG/HupF family hydrogenase formation chaperone n=1 Tax=Demequina sp. TaxID=2050685 RepID=UPI0025C5F89A|nr:HypC/HybG/HupF family hydrogenase formation chaperone [Demequina sp.]
MCLGTVAKVVEVVDEGRAVVEHGGTHQPGRREDVLKMTIGADIRPGDWVVIHSGFVLERISEARALDALAIRNTPPASSAPHHKEMAP